MLQCTADAVQKQCGRGWKGRAESGLLLHGTDGSKLMAKLFNFLLHCNLKNFGDVSLYDSTLVGYFAIKNFKMAHFSHSVPPPQKKMQ